MLDEKSISGQKFINEISKGSKRAFEELFFCYHGELCALATKIIKSPDRARDIVQEVFLRLWRVRKSLKIKSSLKAYLYQAVWNESLNFRGMQQNQQKLVHNFSLYMKSSKGINKINSPENHQELIKKIWKIVDAMPERRRFVFTLHRKHGLSYKEIAKVMSISRKTVENHMGLALQEIRNAINPDLSTSVQLKHYN